MSWLSQTSGVELHWQTLPVWPESAAQVQPATQAAAELQPTVQTLPVQVASPAGCAPGGWFTGRQSPLGQSLFREQGVPIPEPPDDELALLEAVPVEPVALPVAEDVVLWVAVELEGDADRELDVEPVLAVEAAL